MTFSKRQGIEAAKALQVTSMDPELRSSLWNVFHLSVTKPILDNYYFHERIKDSSYGIKFQKLWIHFFKWPLHRMPEFMDSNLEIVLNWFFSEKTPWNRIYDFLEYVFNEFELGEEFKGFCNEMMEREVSAYRFVGNIIARITNEAEIEAIEKVAAESGPLAIVGTHIKDALRLLADRTEPNYRNSMKESISAVESVVKIITGQSDGTLGKMLDKIGPQLKLHQSLVNGFKALYGYTSDDHGIRHAMKDDRVPEQEDARYFLVSCSAFANYLIEKARKLGIL